MLKKILIISIFLLSVQGMNICCYSRVQVDDRQMLDLPDTNPWKRLVSFSPINLTFTHRLTDSKGYDQSPELKQLLSKKLTKVLLWKTKSIAEALEKSGISESVTLQLYLRDASLPIAQLGTFTPFKKKGKTVFSIPKIEIAAFSQGEFEKVLSHRLTFDIPLNRPELCTLEFIDKQGEKQAKVDAYCHFPFQYEHPEYEELDRLLAKEQYEKAEDYCSRLNGLIKQECNRILGDIFFDNILKEQAKKISFFIITLLITTPDAIIGWGRPLFEKADYNKAIYYYEISFYKEGFDKIGLVYFERGDYAEAIKYFEKGTHTSLRANAYAAMADQYLTKENNIELAREYYTKAIDEYEYLIKDYHYVWNRKDSIQRRKCIEKRDSLPKTPEETTQQVRLQRLLAKAADYCDRLDKNFALFFCKEVITESYILSEGPIFNPGSYNFSNTITDKYVYEYQLIREDNKVSEWRTLLKKNGIKKKVEAAQLENRNRYEKLIFGPIAFLSRYWQQRYDYKILREDSVKGEKAVVIEAIPKGVRMHNPLIGNIWLRAEEPGQGDVLKLEWNPKTILNNFEEILNHEQMYNAKLSIVFFADFNIKRQGFRLPDRYYIEEAYIKNNKKKFIRTRTDVIFKDHRYFIVSSEVTKTERKHK